MDDIGETSVRPDGASLGVWALALRPGSPCFCCGRPLRAYPLEAIPFQGAPSRLECLYCGAAVMPCETSGTADAYLDAHEPVLAAA